MTDLKKPHVWLKKPKFEINGQKKTLLGPMGSKGVKNRENWTKIGLK